MLSRVTLACLDFDVFLREYMRCQQLKFGVFSGHADLRSVFSLQLSQSISTELRGLRRSMPQPKCAHGASWLVSWIFVLVCN